MFAFLIALLATPAHAAHPTWGGTGYALDGFALVDLGELDKGLSGTEAPGFYLQYGGGGHALLGGAVLLRGQGYMLRGGSAHGPNTSVDVVGGGGGLDVGVVLARLPDYLIFPYAGAGGIGFSTHVENNTADELAFGDRPIPSGLAADFDSGGWFVDVGAGVQHLLFGPDQQGGFVIGGELGAMIGVSGAAWEDASGTEVTGVPSFSITGFYARMTFGGGGFFYKK